MTMRQFLDFEKPIAVLEGKIEELRHLSTEGDINIADEVGRLQQKITKELTQAYSRLGPWEKVQVARHPDRPKATTIIAELFTDFIPMAGDRNYREDHALLTGMARFRGRPVAVIATEKGQTTEDRIKRNFGMVRPEGYRKARRLMELAGRFGLPVISLVDTAGAYPGRGAEERGQAEAIARSIQACLNLQTPLISAIVGEGGSGGAIALATGNRVIMFEHAVYSVISPEGCASILWRSSDHAKEASQALKLTAQDMKQLGVIDAIVPEPLGAAHRDPETAIANLGDTIAKELEAVEGMKPKALIADRRKKYLKFGSENL